MLNSPCLCTGRPNGHATNHGSLFQYKHLNILPLAPKGRISDCCSFCSSGVLTDFKGLGESNLSLGQKQKGQTSMFNWNFKPAMTNANDKCKPSNVLQWYYAQSTTCRSTCKSSCICFLPGHTALHFHPALIATWLPPKTPGLAEVKQEELNPG